MSSAEGIVPPSAAAVAAATDAPATAAPPPRRRLFRKYALLFVALVGGALLVNSGFDFWFSYQENKAALIRIQQEKANGAAAAHRGVRRGDRAPDRLDDACAMGRRRRSISAARIISGCCGRCRRSPRLRSSTARARSSSRFRGWRWTSIGSGADFSQTPAFTEAKAHRVWFSPVYFRKESEPYMTLAMARAGRNAGVTVAEINLKLIWDVITALKIGQGGYAYVVDGTGRLIAHPDISLVLRDTDLSQLPQVAARAGRARSGGGGAAASPVARTT